MTYLALPWFVLVTTGSPGKMSLVLAAEILPMALLGIPSGSVVGALGGRTTMLIADFARAPIMLSIPLLHSAGMLTFPLLLGIVALLGTFMPPYFAAQRVVLPELVGEDERLIAQGNSMIEGGTAFAGADRAGARGRADPVPRRAERALRRRGDVRDLVPDPAHARAEEGSRSARPRSAACSRGCVSSCATGCSGR